MKETLLEALQLAARVVVPLLAFAVGLGAGEARPLWLWKQRSLLLRSLAAVMLVVPALTVVVAKVLPLKPAVAAGLVVVTLSIGPVMAIVKSRKGEPEDLFAFNLDVWLLVASLFYVPLAVSLLGLVLDRSLRFGLGEVARVVLPLQLVPLAAGALMGRRWPALARRLEPPLSRVANLAFAALVLLLLVPMLKQVFALGALNLAVVFAVALFAVAVGHALGGPAEGTRRVLATFTSMRFPALALSLATLSAAKHEVIPVVLAYLLFTVLILALYSLAGRRLAPHAPAAGAR
jgi:BASS family bile acid:Na+ symporter